MNEQNMKVLVNVIGAVESGGQVYGKRRYDAYAAPYTNSSKEHTITLGWAQNYGPEARRLVQMIYGEDPELFRRIDNGSVQDMLSKDWVALRWNPSAAQKKILIALISSEPGKRCQDRLFAELMEKFIAECGESYTSEVHAVMMYCEIRHLGGKGPADRIFGRLNGDYSLDAIMASLVRDQKDSRSNNQVGDSKFWSRHVKCRQFIEQYAVEEGSGYMQTNRASALSRAKTLLRMPQSRTMTGYTPEGKQNFVAAKAWHTAPRKGDVVYFYNPGKGRVAHVGIVEKVDAAKKMVYTIEGNTSSTKYAENGGCVARHGYSYAAVGGGNRINGFGRPDFAAAGVTAEQFISTAIGELGYLEKRSNSQLDSKAANAGSSNYTKYARDIGAGNGDYWCQYFVDAVALYTCQGVKAEAGSGGEDATRPKEKALNETKKWTGYVTADALNVRVWAGTDSDLCKTFGPLPWGTAVSVCDTVKAGDGSSWYYIDHGGKKGFCSARYIAKAKPSEKKAAYPPKASSRKYAGTYLVLDALNLRNNAGKGSEGATILGVLPKGSRVESTGKYTKVGGVVWHYVSTTIDGVKYSGFCSGAFLERI